MPGRANVHAVLCLGLVVYLAACAEAPRPLRPGELVSERPDQGVILGRVAVIRDGEDRMSPPSFPRSFGWELQQADTGKKFVVDPLTEDGLFALPLPTGLYHVTKLRYEDRYGVWEGSVPASFSVKPSGWTYIGTWELTYAGLGSAVPISAVTRDDLKDERNEFETRYRINAPVFTALLQSASKGHLSLLRPRSEQ
jgi:hypothetical protein